VYDYYQLQEAREQPGGYSTLAPQAAFDFYFRHDRLSCGVWLESDRAELARLGITRVLFHSGLYVQSARRGAWFAWRGLQEQGFGPVARGGQVTLFAPGAPPGPEPAGEPPRFRQVLCSGWSDKRMRATEATIWVYGEGAIVLHVSAPNQTRLRLLADGQLVDRRRFSGKVLLGTTLTGMRWHPLLLETSTPGVQLDTIDF
jgi:hypothetical protein